MFLVPNLAKVKVEGFEEESGVRSTKVRILEGVQSGKVGWVMTEWVY